MPMIVNPTTDNWVELPYHVRLSGRLVRLQDRADFQQERFGIFLGGPDEQLATKLPQVLPEEVEAIPYVRDLCLLCREDETALAQEAFDDRTNLVFQDFAGAPVTMKSSA